MRKKHYLYLTGGLGNQLFQLAAALDLAISSEDSLIIDTVIGKPRVTDNLADIFHLKITDEIGSFSRKANILSSKAAGFLLRLGINPVGLEKNKFVGNFFKFAGEAVLSCRFRSVVKVNAADDVGFYKLKSGRSSVILGYFQSYKYLENTQVRNIFNKLEPHEISHKLLALIEKAIDQKPIFVHVRLNDYLEEKNFGIPKADYYLSALRRLKGETRNIWVFSDDIALASLRMPSEFKNQYAFVDDSGLTPAQLLHLLRFGEDYVIANSSFSWWAATLAIKQGSKVVAPEPWFSGMPEPRDLIPPNWLREKA